MSRFRTALLTAVTVAAVLPALASAQTPPPPDGRDQPRGEARGDRPAPPSGARQGQQPSAPGTPQGQPNFGGDRRGPDGPGGPGGPGRGDQRRPDGPGGPSGYAGRGDGNPGRWGPNAPGGQGGYAGRGDPNRFGQNGPDGRDGRGPDRFGPGGPGGYAGRGPDGRGPDRFGPGGPGGYAGRGPDRGPDRGPGFGRPGGPGAPGFAGWRNDRRYDWRGWRDQNRGLFHGPRYFAPRGYGYRPFAVGYRLDPFFYAERYWIEDPYAYRLPPAEGPYRWVRYFNDVLLVDLRSGTTVDVIRDFFL